jgi:hypothetical protein
MLKRAQHDNTFAEKKLILEKSVLSRMTEQSIPDSGIENSIKIVENNEVHHPGQTDP